MQYRVLGKTGLKVSVIGVGTWQYGGEWGRAFTQQEVNDILAAARDEGLNLIDTAECYGDHLSEQLIGNAIHGQREKWIVATKFGHVFHDFMNRSDRRTAADVAVQLEGSLKALRTDYIDLYQYHSVREAEYDNDELRSFLEKQVKAGKVRHVGNSVAASLDPAYQVQRAEWGNVQAVQVVYNRLERDNEKVFDLCREKGIGVMARVPMASGLLSGKYKPGATFAANDVRATRSAERLAQQLEEVEQIARTEVPAGVNMAQWSLAWCLRDPAVSCVIPGAKSPEQVRSNARAADLLP